MSNDVKFLKNSENIMTIIYIYINSRNFLIYMNHGKIHTEKLPKNIQFIINLFNNTPFYPLYWLQNLNYMSFTFLFRFSSCIIPM